MRIGGLDFRLWPCPHIIRVKAIDGFASGKQKMGFITIDPQHAGNKRLLIHELVHTFQMYCLGIPTCALFFFMGWPFPLWLFGIFLYSLLYTFIPYTRFVSECMAYGIAAHYSKKDQSVTDYICHAGKSLEINYSLPKKDKYSRTAAIALIKKFYRIWDITQ